MIFKHGCFDPPKSEELIFDSGRLLGSECAISKFRSQLITTILTRTLRSHAHYLALRRRKRAVAQFAAQEPLGIDGTRHDELSLWHGAEAETLVIRPIADKQHEAVACFTRRIERLHH